MFNRFFQKLDLFGKPVVFNFNGKIKSRSIVGAWFSILFIGFISWAIYEVGQDMILRQDPKTITSEAFSENPAPMVISPNTFNFGFGLQDPITYAHYINESIYTVEAYVFIQKRVIHENGTVDVIQETVPLALERCRKEHFGPLGSKFETMELSELYCLKEEQANLNEISIEGVFESPYFSDVTVEVKRCESQASKVACAPKEKIDEMLGGWFAVYFTNLAVEPKNYTNPTIGYRDSYYTSISSLNFKELTLWLNHVEVASDFGWLLQEGKLDNYIKLDYPRELLSFRPDTTKVMNFVVRVGKITTSYARSYIKVQDVLAKINGFITAGVLVALTFVAPYSKLKFYERLINELFDIKTLQKSKKKNNKRKADPKLLQSQEANAANNMTNPPLKKKIAEGDDVYNEKNKNLFSPTERHSLVENSPDKKENKNLELAGINLSLQFPELSNTLREKNSKSDSTSVKYQKGMEIDLEAKDSHFDADRFDQTQRSNNEFIRIHSYLDEKAHDLVEHESSNTNSSPYRYKPEFLQHKPTMTPRLQIKVLEHYEPQDPREGLGTFEHLLLENRECIGPKKSYDEHPFVKKKFSKVPSVFNVRKVESAKKTKEDQRKEEELVEQKAEKLPFCLSKDTQKIHISFREYVCSWFWKSESLKEKISLLKEGVRRIEERLDIFNVLKKFREVDKLKLLLLENEQFVLFDTLPNPELSLMGGNGLKRSNSFTHNQLKEIKFIHEKRKSDLISVAYRNLKKRQSKTMIDQRLLEIYDNIIEV